MIRMSQEEINATKAHTKKTHKVSFFEPFNSQDAIVNSPL